MEILPGCRDRPDVVDMLRLHLDRARAETARGSAHALDLDALRAPDIAFFSAWEAETLLGMGALRRLSAEHGEVKSMYTREEARGRGVASAILLHIISAAEAEGMRRLSLETGSWPYFDPARAFYRKHGFTDCPPFGSYAADPNSVFLTLVLAAG